MYSVNVTDMKFHVTTHQMAQILYCMVSGIEDDDEDDEKKKAIRENLTIPGEHTS